MPVVTLLTLDEAAWRYEGSEETTGSEDTPQFRSYVGEEHDK